jgi:hypothetical protein
MRARDRLVLVLVLVLMGCGGGAERGPPEVDVERVVAHAEQLATAVGPRPFDSRESALAAAYIEDELRAMGLSPERIVLGAVDLPPVRVAGRTTVPARIAEVDRDADIVVRLAGAAPGPALVLMAHYDTVPGSPGALDNAASVGLLLELTRALIARPPARPVVVAFTAAEEIGLVGAVVLARDMVAPVGLAVSLDLVGADQTVMNGLGPLMGRPWLVWLHAAADDAGVAVPPPRPHRVVSRLAPEMERSDHGPFARAGVPALHLYGRGASRIFRPYHSPWDTTRWIDRAVLDTAARFVAAVARRPGPLPRSGGDPGLVVAFGDHWTVIPRALGIALELALALAALLALAVLVRRWRRDRAARAAARERTIGLAWILACAIVAWAAAIGIDLVVARTDHPIPWIHAPATWIGIALACAALVGLLLWLGPPGARALAGRGRFAAAGAIPMLLAGAALLAAGAHELAWAPFLAAALLAAGALSTGVPGVCAYLLSLITILPAVEPGFVQELAFHQIFAPGTSLPLYLAAVLAPHSIAAVPHLARLLPRRPSARHRAIAATVAAVLLVALALGAARTAHRAPCDAAAFARHGIACELAPPR